MFQDSYRDVSLTPAVCPKTDFSHWDPFQGSSKESLLQLGSPDSGHSHWPTLRDRLHQQLKGHSMAVESIRVTSTPPPLQLCLFSIWPGQEFCPSQKQSSWPLGLKGRLEAGSGGWGRERTTINEPGVSCRPLRKMHRVREKDSGTKLCLRSQEAEGFGASICHSCEELAASGRKVGAGIEETLHGPSEVQTWIS